MLPSRHVEKQETSGASQRNRDTDWLWATGHSVSNMQRGTQPTFYYTSKDKIYVLVYLPGCHAVKTKHNIKALTHFTNTVWSNDSFKPVKSFVLSLMLHRCLNGWIQGVKRNIIVKWLIVLRLSLKSLKRLFTLWMQDTLSQYHVYTTGQCLNENMNELQEHVCTCSFQSSATLRNRFSGFLWGSNQWLSPGMWPLSSLQHRCRCPPQSPWLWKQLRRLK